jgi:hypothetical protein
MPGDFEASGEDDVMKNLSTFDGAKFLALEGQKNPEKSIFQFGSVRSELIYDIETAPCRFNVAPLLTQALLYKLGEC